jgi:ABC-type branched-subunit amino acid transport system substrate-binding protein
MVAIRKVSALLALSVFAIAACGGSSSSNNTNTSPFVLGVVLSWSGAFGTNGPAQVGAFQAAADHINATGGILGRKVSVVFRDDGSDVNKTVLAVQDLMDNKHADAIWPESVSAFVTAALPFVTQHKLISFDVGSVNDPTKFPYNFQMGVVKQQDVAADVAALTALPNVVSGTPQLKKVAIASTNDASGQLFATSSQQQLSAGGFTTTGTVLFSATAPDLTVQVKQLEAGSPDAILVHVFGPQTGTFMKAINDVGWKNVIVMGDPGAIPFIDLETVVPQAVWGQLYFPQYAGASRLGDTAESPFIDSLLTKGPILSMASAGLVADAMYYMRWAYNKAGTTDADKVKAVLEGVNSLSAKDLPQDLVFFTTNTGYSSTNHSCSQADITSLYALSKVSTLVNGTFQRLTILKTPKPPA